jgi:hypothetical protein
MNLVLLQLNHVLMRSFSHSLSLLHINGFRGHPTPVDYNTYQHRNTHKDDNTNCHTDDHASLFCLLFASLNCD